LGAAFANTKEPGKNWKILHLKIKEGKRLNQGLFPPLPFCLPFTESGVINPNIIENCWFKNLVVQKA